MQISKQIKILLFVLILIAVLYFLYNNNFVRSSFGFGATTPENRYGNTLGTITYAWTDPGTKYVSTITSFSDTKNIVAVTGVSTKSSDFKETSFSEIRAIPWEGAILTPKLNNNEFSIFSGGQLGVFQNFMNNQPNIVCFMSNNTTVKPIMLTGTGTGSVISYLRDNANTAAVLYGNMVRDNNGQSIVIKPPLGSSNNIGGATAATISYKTGSTTEGTIIGTGRPEDHISLNEAISIPTKPSFPVGSPLYNQYMKARANIIIGVLNALTLIYNPSIFETQITPNYKSVSKSIANTGDQPVTGNKEGYVNTLEGGGNTTINYVGLIQEFYNNYKLNKPKSGYINIYEYEGYTWYDQKLTLSPNIKHAIWIYLNARNSWIQSKIKEFNDGKLDAL